MSRSSRSKLSDSDGGSDSGVYDHEIRQLTNLRSGARYMNMNMNMRRPKGAWISPVNMLAARESNRLRNSNFSTADACHILSRYLPVTGPYLVDRMESCAYVSQFSSDGSFLVAGYQGSRIRVYNVEKGWKVHKDILAKSLRWTITDTSLSSDKRYLIYSSMSPIVHIVDLGSSVTESLANITDDVNTVCFADESGHLIYSGSDDSFCKVWDRRCLTSRCKPAGTMIGHLEGITFIDSRGDGRYFISNGKDQSIKLWDIRKMSSSFARFAAQCHDDWDYRWMDYPARYREMKHPNDQSLATYKGHSVLRTLIRCHFSPEYSTGQKYIYTGSNDGAVYTYDLVTGALVSKLSHHDATVRDCSWHPYYPMLISSSWDGTIVRCEFPGGPETPVSPIRRRNRRRQFF